MMEVNQDRSEKQPIYPNPGSKERSNYLNPQGKSLSQFQWRVYDLVIQIPRGKLTTYGNLAKRLSIDSPNEFKRMSAQAVGSALRTNPFAPTVPCHRVIKSDYYIGGFFGEQISTRSRSSQRKGSSTKTKTKESNSNSEEEKRKRPLHELSDQQPPSKSRRTINTGGTSKDVKDDDDCKEDDSGNLEGKDDDSKFMEDLRRSRKVEEKLRILEGEGFRFDSDGYLKDLDLILKNDQILSW